MIIWRIKFFLKSTISCISALLKMPGAIPGAGNGGNALRIRRIAEKSMAIIRVTPERDKPYKV